MSFDRDATLARRVGPEIQKTMQHRLDSGFFGRFMSGPSILDIGFRGGNPDNQPIVPHAIGVDMDYPGYDGKTLPFADLSQDAVHSSHCLEHIPDPINALSEWFRVLRIGGFLVLTVPHQQLYERKPTPTSRWGGNDHRRYYTPATLLAEIESALPCGEFRIRLLRDNDQGFDYGIPADAWPEGCYEIEVVIQRIQRPAHAANLVLSPAAKAAIESYRVMIASLLRLDAAGATPDRAALEAFGKAVEIPPYAVVQSLFPDVPDATMRRLLPPLVDPSCVDRPWYIAHYPDVRAIVKDDPDIVFQHYRRAGYFERKLPAMRLGLYG